MKTIIEKAFNNSADIIGDRYRVERNRNILFDRYSVKAGDGQRSIYNGTFLECHKVASELTTASMDGAFINMLESVRLLD